MKAGINDIVGKTVSGVVVSQRAQSPKCLLFLVFADGTFYEMYGDDTQTTSGVCKGGVQAAIDYANLFKPDNVTTFTYSSSAR